MKYYITKTEIAEALGITYYKASNVFKKVKQHHLDTNTPLIDRSTVSTRLLCKYLKLPQEELQERL